MRQNKFDREDFWMHCGEMRDEMKDTLYAVNNDSEAEISLGDEWFSLFCC